ncbi:MAG TPA: 6-phosphogluconolactonase, partial [Chitinophagaceae bacterium]|nr:6-phosphogluconolactonase [Chitinophagaceae bacterium]
VSILGLGMNGHVGMNEPGTAPNLHSHISDLHSTTKQVGQKYFTKEQVLTQGITLGLATLMESRHLMLLVSGAHKARIIQKVLEENVSEQLPGSLLRNHADFSVYLEPTSAQLLKQQLQKS